VLHQVLRAHSCTACSRRLDKVSKRHRLRVCAKCRAQKQKHKLQSNPELRAKANENARQYRLRRWHVRMVTVLKISDPHLSITPEQVLHLFRQQNGRCYWFNVPLRPTASGRIPSQPSLDRLDNSKPHSFENCVLACYAANIGRNNTPVHVWKRFVRSIHRHKPSRL